MTIIIRNDADMIRWVLKAPERHPKLVGFGCEPAISVKAPKEIMQVIYLVVHLESVHATCRYARLLCQTHHCSSRLHRSHQNKFWRAFEPFLTFAHVSPIL